MVELVAIGRIVPRSIILRVARMLDMAGINIMPEAFVGIVIILATSIPLSAFLLLSIFIPQYAILVSICIMFVVLGLVYAFLMLRTEDRKNRVEAVLPDFLQLASANVRAGMPIDRALWFAARPEFGLLSEEVELVTKRTFSGEPFIQSIRRLSTRFNSKTLERTINLLVEGMSSGGEVAALLEKTGMDIRSLQLLHKEIAGMMLMYIIFIVFASCFGAPLLYALSYQLINITNVIWAGILEQNPEGLPTGGMLFLSPQPPGISSQDFFTFSLLSTIITTVIASFIIAVIQTGNSWNGLKIIPFLTAAGLAVFFITGWIFSSIFSSILH